MSFNPLAILHERQCAAVYNALDTGQPTNAIRECDAILQAQPNVHLASALKALALCRTNKHEEANKVADSVIALDGTQLTSSLLIPLGMALTSLQRERDEVDVLEKASKAQPNAAELTSKACLAMARTSQWQRMQQTALRLHKLESDASSSKSKGKSKKIDDLHFWWSMQAYCLMANDASINGHQLALPLAQRMIAKHLETFPFADQSDEAVSLYVRILQKRATKEAREEALQFLSSNAVGKSLCKRSLSLTALQVEIQEELGQWEAILAAMIDSLKQGERNWAVVELVVKAALQHPEQDQQRVNAIRKADDAFVQLSSADGKKDRTAKLAPILLYRRTIEAGQKDALTRTNLVDLIIAYFDAFATHRCTYEDLEPAVHVVSESEQQTLVSHFGKHFKVPSQPFATFESAFLAMNACKLVRRLQTGKGSDVGSELAFAQKSISLYRFALPLGKDLPETEMQPADDFALMAAQALVSASALQRTKEDAGWRHSLYLAHDVLQASLAHSPKGYRQRILLIRLLLQFGAVTEAQRHYEKLDIKAVQFDTLGWTIASRFAMLTLLLSPGSKQEREWLAALRKMRDVWNEAKTQVPAVIVKAFEHGTFSRIEEMVVFTNRLTNSIARYLHCVEFARLQKMKIDTGLKTTVIESEMRDCHNALEASSQAGGKEIFDQRDRRVLPNYLPFATKHDILSLTENAQSGFPDRTYLEAVAKVAFKSESRGPQDASNQDSNLSQEEETLSEIADKINHGASSGAEQEATRMFDSLVSHLRKALETPNALPFTWLQSAGSVLEAYYLVKDRASEELKWTAAAKGALEEARSRLQERVAALEESQKSALKEAQGSTNEQWRELLSAVSPHQQGKNGQSVLLKDAIEAMENGTLTAVNSLLLRISNILSK